MGGRATLFYHRGREATQRAQRGRHKRRPYGLGYWRGWDWRAGEVPLTPPAPSPTRGEGVTVCAVMGYCAGTGYGRSGVIVLPQRKERQRRGRREGDTSVAPSNGDGGGDGIGVRSTPHPPAPSPTRGEGVTVCAVMGYCAGTGYGRAGDIVLPQRKERQHRGHREGGTGVAATDEDGGGDGIGVRVRRRR